MKFFRTENNSIIDGPNVLPRMWRSYNGIQYPLAEMWSKGHTADVIALGWLPQELVTSEYDPIAQVVDGYTNEVLTNKVVSTEKVRPMTAEEEEAALARRKDNARNECSQRIFSIVDANAQINLASAAAAGLLTPEQMTTYQSGLQWVSDMRNTWPTLAEQGVDIDDDTNWPTVPAGVQELANQF